MPDLSKLTPAALDALRKAQRDELRRRKGSRPFSFFPWHAIQKFILRIAEDILGDVRIFLIAGGNRGGKSKSAMGMMSMLLRRVSPMNEQLQTTDADTGEIKQKGPRDPLTIWVVPPTLEKGRSDWINPQDRMGIRYWCGDLYLDERKSPDHIIFSRPPGLPPEDCYDSKGRLLEDRVDKIFLKSQDQDILTFESSEVDLVIFDEEPAGKHAEKIWNSCLLRIATTHGFIVMAYTPLHGLSWSYKRYWKPLVKDGAAKKVADRCWVHAPKRGATVVCAQMGSRDNPRARDYADEIEMDPFMSQAEKDARLYGEYGFVEGALIRALAGIDVANPLPEHERYVVDYLPGDRSRETGKIIPGKIVKWYLVADPNKSYGAVLSALDRAGNLYFVSEHLMVDWPDRLHAKAFKEMEKAWVRGPIERYADPGGAGAHSIVNMNDLGVAFNTMPKGADSVSTSVKRLRGIAFMDPGRVHPITGDHGAPRVYFYRPGLISGSKTESELANQISQARQTDNDAAPMDTPHKDIRSRLDLFDCARYTANLVVGVSEHEENHGRGHGPADRLPKDESLGIGETEDIPNWWDQDIYLPEYSWGESSWN